MLLQERFITIPSPPQRFWLGCGKGEEGNVKFYSSNRYSDADLEELIQEVVKASNRGVSAARNVSGEPNWSFGQSLFFSSTVVTTIGYGHVTPLSKGGKVFCIVYAMLGIPLTLILLTALVERLMVPATMLLQFLNSRLGHLYQPFNIRLLHLFLIAVILVGMFVLVPAGVFATLEPEWDYLDSLYYCIISLTTIGLGDYIPGDSPNQPYRPIYKVVTTVHLTEIRTSISPSSAIELNTTSALANYATEADYLGYDAACCNGQRKAPFIVIQHYGCLRHRDRSLRFHASNQACGGGDPIIPPLNTVLPLEGKDLLTELFNATLLLGHFPELVTCHDGEE
uniref:Potassium channel domain-containing protein n=1 Tax=Timema genevievae TaxID=629358 RepID=A0A7R9K0C7_TIMGE|nr:unnamed protein product [Timema genevievae]